MNRDEIWQQLKDDKTLVYNEPILDVFLKLTKKLNKNHYQELGSDQKKEVDVELRLRYATNEKEIEEAIKDGATDLEERFVDSVRNNEMDLIKYFIEERGIFSLTSLRVAGYKGDLKTIKYLISRFSREDLDDLKNASIYFHERLGQAIAYLLEGASQGGNLDAFKYLVEELGAKPEEILEIPVQEFLDMHSIPNNYMEILKYLCNKIDRLPYDEKLDIYKKISESANRIWAYDFNKVEISDMKENIKSYLNYKYNETKHPSKGYD